MAKKKKNKKTKDSDYFDSPLDHPDVDAIKKINEERDKIKYSDKENKFKNETGLDGPKMAKERKRAKRFVDYIQGMGARKRTAKEGSFKKGGRVGLKSGGIAIGGKGCEIK